MNVLAMCRWSRTVAAVVLLTAPVVVGSTDEHRSGFDDGSSESVPHFRQEIPLELALLFSERVARVKFIDTLQQAPSNTSACPNTYRAAVIESFKGGDESFELFVPAKEDFRGFDTEYIVIAKQWKSGSRDIGVMLDEIFSPDESEMISRCRMATSLYVAGGYKSMWAIDPALSKRMGQEWLEADTRPAISWCTYDSAGDPPADVYVPEGVRVGMFSYEAVSVAAARRLITRAMKNLPEVIDGSIARSFVPASCE